MTLLIGAHTSAAGGVHNALLEGKEIGATTIQLFTSNQKQWHSKPISDEEIVLWKKALDETGIKKVMSHDSYLINLGCPNPENLSKSRSAFAKELDRCQQLDLAFLNFHPGAALTGTEEDCLDLIIESLKQLEKQCAKGNVRLLLETTAGQGSCVGYCFEHLDYIIREVKNIVPIGVCIDTCHIFAAGYDLRTKKACEETIADFDKAVGLHHLYAFHLNDSMKGLGSNVDRHAPLGKGEIGMEAFAFVMQHPKLKNLPKYLETPDGPPLWREEIQLLQQFGHRS